MKFKIANPEDYTDIDQYAFKLAKAYADNYGSLITALSTIKIVYDAILDDKEFGAEFAISQFKKILEKFEQ